MPLSRQLLETAAEGCDATTPEGRAKLLSAARPLWNALPEGALKAQLVDELASRGGLQRADLLRLWKLAPDGRAPREGGDGAGAGASRSRWNGEGGPPRGGRGRPLRGAANLLDRALWILLHDPVAWDGLGPDDHALLAEQAAPYGQAVALIERRLHDEGPEAPATLLAALSTQDPGPATASLVERVGAFVPPAPEIDLKAELRRVVDRLVLQAIEEELQGMFESGALSEDAARRSRDLVAQRAELKARLGAAAPA